MYTLDKKLTIIKYGSNTLVHANVHDSISIDYNTIYDHGSIINAYDGPIIIVSSGAVALGKTINQFAEVDNEVIRKRMCASLGNPHLSMNRSKAIPDKYILQGLITHRDLSLPDTKKSLKEMIYHTYQTSDKNIILVNDNDFISDEELKKIRGGNFGDNDRLTTLLAELCDEIFTEVNVIINTSTDGVLDGTTTIPKLDTDALTDAYIEKLCGTGKTSLGTGGMNNKLKILRDLVSTHKNIQAHIINGKHPIQLKNTLAGKHNGTKIYIAQ